MRMMGGRGGGRGNYLLIYLVIVNLSLFICYTVKKPQMGLTVCHNFRIPTRMSVSLQSLVVKIKTSHLVCSVLQFSAKLFT